MIVTIAIHAVFIWVLGLTMTAKPPAEPQETVQQIKPLQK